MPPAPAADVSSGTLRTSTDRFVLERRERGWEVTIAYTYENPTDGPVFMTTCHGPHPPLLEKWDGSRWVLGWHPIHLLCLGPPLRIEAGESHSDELWLFAGYPSSNDWPRFEMEDWEGVYRLVWWPRSSYEEQPPFGDLLPLEHRVSRPFQLVEGD
ncbi:MAG TPA: hypothetical protein VM778_13935 [Gemmatimonadota bacterium]|nr:hypothetical protein [Gemmatimonadota bacterium]